MIAVSAITDLDGEPGGQGGCALFILYCDDQLAFFSNYGSVVDVTAPGALVYSTWQGGGYQNADGASMASPHAAGVVALIRAANPAPIPPEVAQLLTSSGECPDGTWADTGATGCAGHGQWGGDPDGIAEPPVNTLRAAAMAGGWEPPPPPPPPPQTCYDYTISGGSKPYASPPAQPGICIPTDAEVATMGHPWALWATIDVAQANAGEVRFGELCTGGGDGTGYGMAVTRKDPPDTTIG